MAYSLKHKTNKKISKGSHIKLGATLSKNGVNFALYSRHADQVFVLLFYPEQAEPTDIIMLHKMKDDIWCGHVQGLKAGQLYAYKVQGRYNPKYGLRFNENKLLIDPYAKAINGDFVNQDNLLFAYDVNSPDADLSFDDRDNTHIVPKCVVVDDTFNWKGNVKPNIPMEQLIIYEVHLKGFTAHSSSGVAHPGTYLGFIEKIPYLKELGINAVELLPIHQFYKRDGLVKMGLTDYWGYNTIGFFAPEYTYGTCQNIGSQVNEFKALVKALHHAGIEIILDVVYNHTGEGDEIGTTLCFRGIDNLTYYSLRGDRDGEPSRLHVNDAGCGNTFDVENHAARRLVMDSLRYWVEEMKVDGFRFDLASILPRVQGQYSKDSAFFDEVAKDPVLKNVKLIAEPWDLTTYQVGNFPMQWSEWNGKFRDTTRRFIKGDAGQARELTYRLTGSEDLYGDDGRTPYDSINFFTAHDGFTLRDLYTYNEKHNEANGENNRDGSNDNFSWNCGVEGETQDQAIVAFRKKMIKNALTCLLTPLGTPMLLGGDEFMRTQRGNNNAYCQDNDLSWVDWNYASWYHDMLDFTRKIIAFRKRYTILQKRKFPPGHDLDFNKIKDVAWYGMNLDKINLDDPEVRTFCCELDGTKENAAFGPYHLIFILNAHWESHTIRLPQYDNFQWHRVIDTSLSSGDDIRDVGNEQFLDPAEFYCANPRSVVGILGKWKK